ncbi:hypothetical protein G5T42_03490 [Microbacterium sp. 4R-513]|uniref:hypothetical protein n=1 Tax=Microbacterium sp. 4R-513 TaxID=2567934 RepID=UPI0013E1C71A|nr:hypothetical protein [Microbacterium sp. 4R-513]QIG38662.1 hypothetical protein G5T42_03490 [Microbacterium sp. 4R-513]
MKRIDVVYDGHTYSVGGVELEDLQQEIAEGVAGGPHWLKVNEGEGDRRDALLLITPATSISLIPIPEGVSAPEKEMGSWEVQTQITP